jgi:hypothetical protein
MSVRITCINKAQGVHFDPHSAILTLGWTDDQTMNTGKSTREQVYEWLKNQNGVAYVVDQYGNKAYVFPRENIHGTKFVQTAADRVWTDNLLALPECP